MSLQSLSNLASEVFNKKYETLSGVTSKIGENLNEDLSSKFDSFKDIFSGKFENPNYEENLFDKIKEKNTSIAEFLASKYEGFDWMDDISEAIKSAPSVMDVIGGKYVDEDGNTFLDIITDNPIVDLLKNKFGL